MDKVTVLFEGRVVDLEGTLRDGTLRVPPEALAAFGWKLEGPGLCHGDLCTPARDPAVLQGDLAAVARLLDRPFVLDVTERVAALGAPANERAARLASLEAPDFSLPDLGGRRHALSEHRNKRRMLVFWASW